MPINRIHKQKDGRYSYAVTAVNGKTLSIKSRKTENLTEFKKRCDVLDKKSLGMVTDETLDDLFDNWLENHVKIHNSNSDQITSKGLYERHVSPQIGFKQLDEITRADVFNVLTNAVRNGLATETIKLIRGCISRPFNWAINSLGYQMTSPTQGLVFKYPKEKKEVRVITNSELKRFFEAAQNSKYYYYFMLLNLTGLRPSEALGVKMNRIKKTHLEIRQGITKTDDSKFLKTENADRDFPMTPELYRILTSQRKIAMQQQTSWLFPSESGYPMMNAIQHSFRRILKQTAVHKLGGRNGMKKLELITPPIDFSLYDFRHTFATRMVENGMPPHLLQYLLGHKDISTTMKYYVGLTDKMISQATEIMTNIKSAIDTA